MYRIAIIEDDISIQQMYKMRLEIEGYNIQTANDGQAGLEIIKSFLPDLILLDLKMPIMDGATMLEQLRATQQGADVKVIILTNISRDEAPRSLGFLHVDRYIVKAHHTPHQMTDIIAEILG